MYVFKQFDIFFIHFTTLTNFNGDIILVQEGQGAENKIIYFLYYYFINWNFCEMSSHMLFNYIPEIPTLGEKRCYVVSYVFCIASISFLIF